MGHDSPVTTYPVIFLVSEDTPQLAREAVVRLCVGMVVSSDPPMVNFSLSYIAPVRADSEDGQSLIERQWKAYEEQVFEDLATVCRRLVPLLHEEDRPTELVESVGFRSACYRIGVISGWPVRIYGDMGLGICTKTELEAIISEENPWVIEVEVE